MLKELLNLWSRDDLLQQAYSEAHQMLGMVQEMFAVVAEGLLSGKMPEYDLHQKDKKVNEMEREVRRKVLEHLSVNPKQDVVAGLVLTSIINDIERIGDYSKNIQELIDLYRNEFVDVQYMLELRQLTRAVQDVFELVYEAFKEGDSEKAALAIESHKTVRKEFDKIIEEVFETGKEDDLKRALVSVLYSRYLKRVAAHLKNIATSVSNPFDMIGYTKKHNNSVKES